MHDVHPRKMRTYREYLIEIFTDREEAIAHIEVALEDYPTYVNSDGFRFLLQTVIEAQGGVFELAKQNDMDPQAFSRMLTHEKTPLIDALGTVLNVLGHQLSIKPIDPEDMNLETYSEALETQNAPAHVAEKEGVRTEQPEEIG